MLRFGIHIKVNATISQPKSMILSVVSSGMKNKWMEFRGEKILAQCSKLVALSQETMFTTILRNGSNLTASILTLKMKSYGNLS